MSTTNPATTRARELENRIEALEAYDRAPGLSIHDLLIEGDEMHPNDAGHALIAQWIPEVLVDDVKSTSARD